jgi:uncharacterized membrane protein HdeD (DUF308 family)
MAEAAGGLRRDLDAERRWWWVPLVTGIGWIFVAFLVLQLDPSTVTAVAVLAGVVFLVGAVTEFVALWVADDWKWLHALMGALLLVGGVAALAWPGRTFLVVASLIGWYLLLKGSLDVAVAIANRDVDLWWLQLAVGIVELLAAFWAVGYTGRSIVLLAIWVAAAALTRGITEIVLAFQLRSTPAG